MSSRNKLPTSSKGSLSIIVSILKSPAETRWTSYHQMVLGISTFDLVGSTGYVFSSAMIAKSSGLYGAAGNDTTCQLQGFMIQLGYTSIFYNLGLSCYFFLVICHSWKERQFQKFHVYVHVITLVLGCGLAFGALSFVGPQYGVCHVSSTDVLKRKATNAASNHPVVAFATTWCSELVSCQLFLHGSRLGSFGVDCPHLSVDMSQGVSTTCCGKAMAFVGTAQSAPHSQSFLAVLLVHDGLLGCPSFSLHVILLALQLFP